MPCQCRFGIVTLTCDRSFHDRECPGHRRGWHGKDGGRHEKAAIAFGRRQCCDIHSFGMVTGSAAGLKKTCPSQFLADHLHGPSLTGYDRRRITCCELVTLRGTAYVAGCKVHGAVLGATRHRVFEGMVHSIRPHPLSQPSMQQRPLSVYGPCWWIDGFGERKPDCSFLVYLRKD